jgi:hypothetical protein
MPAEILILSIVRALIEVALLSLAGQGAVALLAGAARERNPVYRVFAIVTAPVLHGVRRVLPRAIGERTLAVVTFVVLFACWVLLALAKRSLCHAEGMFC